MFTDIVGYTAMMQQDESHAAESRARHRRIFTSQHQDHQGEIIQYYGDGTLSIFGSAVEAVKCAIQMQRQFREGLQILPVRIGIHLGDIVYSNSEVYGDGVNTTSRIESLGVAGSILISGSIEAEVKNHHQIQCASLGFFEFKNIQKPIEVLAVTNSGLVIPERNDLSYSKSRRDTSVAVLPLINLSADPKHEYWCDGMTEEVMNALVKVKGLKVTSRTSSFHFKGKQATAKEIGEALNVSSIMQGSVRIHGNRIRLTIQLVEVERDFVFWSEKFDRSLDDIFEVQDEVSLLIADQIREQFGHLDIDERLVDHEYTAVDAYTEYLRSRYLMLKMGRSELQDGMDILLNTIKKHPTYARAYLGVHLGYTLQATLGFVPAADAFAAGKPYLERAIELNPNLPECQLNLSYVAFLQDWDTETAYQHLNNALSIKPTVEYYQSMASVLVAEGKFGAALEYIDHAMQLDPYSEINHHLQGFVHYVQEKYQKAIALFRKSMQLRPDSQVSLSYIGQSLVLLGQYDEAIAFYRDLPSPKNDQLKLGGTALAQAVAGRTSEAKKGIDLLTKSMGNEMTDQEFMLLIACQCQIGDHDAALGLIAQGLKWKLPMMVYLGVEPLLVPLRSSKIYQELIAQVIEVTPRPRKHLSKYKYPLLEPDEKKLLSGRLEKLMRSEKPFLDPNLTLRKLAGLLEIPPNKLSQLLNENFRQNYAEFVNRHRLEVFKQLATDPQKRHLTLLGLAFESGFNSKSVFNNYFKKAMKQTPKAYLKSISTQ